MNGPGLYLVQLIVTATSGISSKSPVIMLNYQAFRDTIREPLISTPYRPRAALIQSRAGLVFGCPRFN